jgi:hypothetical protein
VRFWALCVAPEAPDVAEQVSGEQDRSFERELVGTQRTRQLHAGAGMHQAYGGWQSGDSESGLWTTAQAWQSLGNPFGVGNVQMDPRFVGSAYAMVYAEDATGNTTSVASVLAPASGSCATNESWVPAVDVDLEYNPASVGSCDVTQPPYYCGYNITISGVTRPNNFVALTWYSGPQADGCGNVSFALPPGAPPYDEIDITSKGVDGSIVLAALKTNQVVGITTNSPGSTGYSKTCTCVPTDPTTACAGSQCGTVSDGCGGSISCGRCASGSVCQYNACVPHRPIGTTWCTDHCSKPSLCN